MYDTEVHKTLHIAWGLAVFSQKQEFILLKKALSQHYRNRLVSDWHYINQSHYCYFKKTHLYSYIGYGYRHVEYGSSRVWSGITETADFLTPVELFPYLPILLSSVHCSSENQPLPHPDMTDVLQDLLVGDEALHRMPGAEQELISSSCSVNFSFSKSGKEQWWS